MCDARWRDVLKWCHNVILPQIGIHLALVEVVFLLLKESGFFLARCQLGISLSIGWD